MCVLWRLGFSHWTMNDVACRFSVGVTDQKSMSDCLVVTVTLPTPSTCEVTHQFLKDKDAANIQTVPFSKCSVPGLCDTWRNALIRL